MKTEEKELSLGTASETSNSNSSNEELVTRKQIPGTPFNIIGANEKWWGTMGKYRLTEQLDTEEDAVMQTTTMTWDRVIQIMQALIEINQEEKEFKTTGEKLKKKLRKNEPNTI